MRRTTIFRHGPVVLLAAGLVLVGVAPASARSDRFLDPAHDAVRISQSHAIHPAPHRRDVDIRDARVRHGLNRVDVRLRFRDLKVGSLVMDVAYATSRTKHAPGPLPSSEVRWDPAHPHRPVVTITSGHVTCSQGPGSRGSDGIRTHTYYESDVVSLSFPRACLTRRGAKPGWIRASITVRTADGPLYWDEVSYSGPLPVRRPVGWFSPRVYAGPPPVGKTRHDT